ncbi:MAG: hypothetical protein G3I10_10860 [Ferrovum sp.]|nr:hypothetical protein [Ferrovum sp.]
MGTLIRFVLLTIDGLTYALPLEAVDRIIRMFEITPLPGAPSVVGRSHQYSWRNRSDRKHSQTTWPRRSVIGNI